MLNIGILNKFVKYGINTWLRFICSSIDINTLNLIINNNSLSRIEDIYLEAINLIYQNIFINKIIIRIY